MTFKIGDEVTTSAKFNSAFPNDTIVGKRLVVKEILPESWPCDYCCDLPDGLEGDFFDGELVYYKGDN